MMRAYSESYLEEVVETQGKLFDQAPQYYHGIDMKGFICAYMKSKTRGFIDVGQPYVCTMNAEELWKYFCEKENFVPQNGEVIGGFVADWIGEFYAYFQWYYNLASKEVVKLVPVDFLLVGYAGLHDLELDLAVKKVGEHVFK